MPYSFSFINLVPRLKLAWGPAILLTTSLLASSAFSQEPQARPEYQVPPGYRYPGSPYAIAKTESIPPGVKEILTQFEEESSAVTQAAEKAQRSLRHRARKELEKLLQSAIEEKRLDEAILIRNKIRDLQSNTQGVLENVWNMSAYAQYIGKSFLIRITGDSNASVYGTDIYTFDTALAGAAVHTGLLKTGETGVLKVTMLPGQRTYEASTRNGVTSQGYSEYPYSYKLESIDDEDDDTANQITPELEASLKESRLQNERLEESLKKTLETLKTLESQLQKLKR